MRTPRMTLSTSTLSPAAAGIRDAGAPGAPSILEEGRNCWRIRDAERVRFLVDGEEFFDAVSTAIARATRSIFVLGWDLAGDAVVDRAGRNAPLPSRLGDLLEAVVSRRHGPHAYLLVWDFAAVFALSGGLLPLFRLKFASHRRLHLMLDGDLPVGACHHQKVVVVDDKVAFVGGFDLTTGRWDTSAHLADDPRRKDRSTYGPWHDVQVMVDGPAARALGELARERWSRATGRRVPLPGEAAAPRRSWRGFSRRRSRALAPPPDPWGDVEPSMTGVSVAIARTEPERASAGARESAGGARESAGGARESAGGVRESAGGVRESAGGVRESAGGVREIEALHLDAVAAARRTIYVENQYLTSRALAEALSARLAEPGGPEVVVVGPKACSGWLEEVTMDVVRARVLRQLRAADRDGRLGVYYPAIGPDCSVLVHSKLLIADDRLVRIGSANASNRSFGLDMECDVAIEAGPGQGAAARAIEALRDRLLSEHLGVEPAAFTAQVARSGSCLRAIEELRSDAPGARTLVPLDETIAPELDHVVPESAIVDPEQPVPVEDMAAALLQEPVRRPAGRTLPLGAAGVFALAAASVFVSVPVAAMADAVDGFSVPQLVVALVLATMLRLPPSFTMLALDLRLGPALGVVAGLGTALLAAGVAYGMGRRLPRQVVRRMSGSRTNLLSKKLLRAGVPGVTVALLTGAHAPATVGLVAGGTRVPLLTYLSGAAAGLAPVALVTGLVAALAARSPTLWALPAAIALAAAFGLRLLAASSAGRGLAASARRTTMQVVRGRRRRGERARSAVPTARR